MNKQVIIDSPRKIKIIEAEMPVQGESEVLLKMLYCGICGSDMSIYRGMFAYASYPRIPGHEVAA